jgi:glycosyltransferase involved in cell wall biosynthesis
MDTPRIAFGYDSVDNDYFIQGADRIRASGVAGETGLPNKYFLYVGRLAEEKGLDTLLDAFCRYRRAGGDWKLVLVGDGPRMGLLRARAEQLAIADAIEFHGLRKGDDLLRYYAFAGCFVLPSTREPWGLVVNEAMAAGLPVIVSTQCGCADDLVEYGGNGFTFDPKATEALSGLMRKISDCPEDVRIAMGNRSRALVDTVSLAKWAEGVAGLVRA